MFANYLVPKFVHKESLQLFSHLNTHVSPLQKNKQISQSVTAQTTPEFKYPLYLHLLFSGRPITFRLSHSLHVTCSDRSLAGRARFIRTLGRAGGTLRPYLNIHLLKAACGAARLAGVKPFRSSHGFALARSMGAK